MKAIAIPLLLCSATSFASSERSDSSETLIFCKSAAAYFQDASPKQVLGQLNMKHCLGQTFKVASGEFFHKMEGVVLLKKDLNGLEQAYFCEMTFGGLPENNDIVEPMACRD